VVEHYSQLRFADAGEVRGHIAGHFRAWAGQLGRHAVVRLADGAFVGQVHLNPYVNAYRWPGEPARPVHGAEAELALAFWLACTAAPGCASGRPRGARWARGAAPAPWAGRSGSAPGRSRCSGGSASPCTTSTASPAASTW